MRLSNLNFDSFFALPKRRSRHTKKATPANPPPPAEPDQVPDTLRRISSGPNPFSSAPKSRRGRFLDRSKNTNKPDKIIAPQIALSDHGDYTSLVARTTSLPRAPRSPRSPRYQPSIRLEAQIDEKEKVDDDDDKGSLKNLRTFLRKSSLCSPQPAPEAFPVRKNIREDRTRPPKKEKDAEEKETADHEDDRGSLKNLKLFISNSDLFSDKKAGDRSSLPTETKPRKIDHPDIKVPTSPKPPTADDAKDDDDRGSLKKLKTFIQNTDILSSRTTAARLVGQDRPRSYQNNINNKSFTDRKEKEETRDEDDRGSLNNLKTFVQSTDLYANKAGNRSSLPVPRRKINHPAIRVPDDGGSLKDFSTVYKREGKFERKARRRSLMNTSTSTFNNGGNDDKGSLKDLKEFAQSTALCSPTVSPQKADSRRGMKFERGSGSRKSLVLQDYINNDEDDRGSLKDLKEFAQSTALCSPKVSPQKSSQRKGKREVGNRKSLVLDDYINNDNDEDDRGSLKDFARKTDLCSPPMSPTVPKKRSLTLQDYISGHEDVSTTPISPTSPQNSFTGRNKSLGFRRTVPANEGVGDRRSATDLEPKAPTSNGIGYRNSYSNGIGNGSRRRTGQRIRSSLTSQQEMARKNNSSVYGLNGAVDDHGSLQNIKEFMDGSDFVRLRKCNGKEVGTTTMTTTTTIGRRTGSRTSFRPAQKKKDANSNVNASDVLSDAGVEYRRQRPSSFRIAENNDNVPTTTNSIAPPTSPVSSERTNSNESNERPVTTHDEKVDLLERLTKEEADIMVYKGSEPEYSGKYTNFFPCVGTFHCKGCSQALYSAAAKFDSRTGYPSFDCCFNGAVKSYGFRKKFTLKCSNCLGHLGHLFEGEWLSPTNERHSVNSLALVYHSNPHTENELDEVTLRSKVEV